MSRTEEDFQALCSRIDTEYARMCHVLQLDLLPLDIALATEEDASGGFNGSVIVIRPDPYDLGREAEEPPVFPPVTWNINDPAHPNEWPQWRMELLHEVVHQVQLQRFQNWDPNDGKEGHGEGWYEACEAVARGFGTIATVLRGVL